jgi:predicted ATP-dependent endonuclease of OLD family
MSSITQLTAENFLAFKSLDLKFCKGVNVLIGSNGTGKTHILKTLYAACAITEEAELERGFAQKLIGVFQPFEGKPGRLAYRVRTSITAKVTVFKANTKISASFSNHTQAIAKIVVTGESAWKRSKSQSAYIPVKEMLAHAPGFISTARKRELAFEEVYTDIISRALLPSLKGPVDARRKIILNTLQSAIHGKVTTKGEVFFLKNKQGDLEFTLLSEGIRKLALIWILTQNGTLTQGSTLFWDEPEANLNPSRLGEVVEVILELQRMGVQVFVSTHNYVLLKEFEIRTKKTDVISYTSLYRNDNKDDKIESEIVSSVRQLSVNKIMDTYNKLYDSEIERAMRGFSLD